MAYAVIFDMDGVLVDSYEAHYQSWQALAAEEGVSFSQQDFARTFGRTSRDILANSWPSSRRDEERIEELDDRKERLYREIIARDFPAMPGARMLIQQLRDAGFLVAVGSSGPPENVAVVLERLGTDLFDVVVTGMDVRRGKPDPEVFLLAAERLGVPADRCAVIEDAPPGIEAARRAGMASVALLSTGRTKEEFAGIDPDLVAARLLELTPERLKALIDRRSD
jgi:beta-phosphoglucomutase